MKNFKVSHYNVLIPVPEVKEFLLYNTTTGGLEVLGWKFGTLLEWLDKSESFVIDDHPNFTEHLNRLVKKGYIVDAEIDELAEYQRVFLDNQKEKFYDNSTIGLTIGTTIVCNMGCPYCFEFTKPNKTLKDEKVINAIITYLEGMIEKAPVNRWETMMVTWYGGEPLINTKGIDKLSPRLTAFADKHGIPYSSMVITNGILLDEETWQVLKRNRITTAQITIDGPKEIHNKYRPLKNKTGKNYERILENLAMIPEGLEAIIRINTDQHVARGFEHLLSDLEAFGIWPQKYKQVKLEPAWLRTYEEAEERNLMGRLSNDEFFGELQRFRKLQYDRFKNWAGVNGLPDPKMQWKFPKLQSDCATWVSPYFLVIDPQGDIHKCWETIHNDQKKVVNVFDEWRMEDFDYYQQYDRSSVHSACKSCKYLPVCDGLSCSYETTKEEKLPCTYWKNNTVPFFKEQYLQMKKNPDKIVLANNEATGQQAHANR